MKPEITYYKNGKIKLERWWKDNAKELHRLDGPACRAWFRGGQLSSEEWYVNDLRHRLDGSAWRGWDKNGRVLWEHWYVNNVPHRLDGPARQWYGSGQLQCGRWFINGVEYDTEAKFQVAVDLYKANEIAELF